MTCPYCLTYLPPNDLCFCAGAVKARRSAFSLPDTSIYPQLIPTQKRIADFFDMVMIENEGRPAIHVRDLR